MSSVGVVVVQACCNLVPGLSQDVPCLLELQMHLGKHNALEYIQDMKHSHAIFHEVTPEPE